MVSVKTQTEIQTAQVEVQTTPVLVRPHTTLVSIETQTIKVREAQTAKTKGEIQDEMAYRRQSDKEKQVVPIYPWDHMCQAAREAEGQLHNLLPLHEAPTGRNNQSMRVNKPFTYQEIQRIKDDLGDYLEDCKKKYIRAFKGVTLLYDLTWKYVMYILGKAIAYGD